MARLNEFVILACLVFSLKCENSTNWNSTYYCELNKYCTSMGACSNFSSLMQLEKALPNSISQCMYGFYYNNITSIDIYANMFQGPVSGELNLGAQFYAMIPFEFRAPEFDVNFHGFIGIDLNITTNAAFYEYILAWKNYMGQYYMGHLFCFAQFELFFNGEFLKMTSDNGKTCDETHLISIYNKTNVNIFSPINFLYFQSLKFPRKWCASFFSNSETEESDFRPGLAILSREFSCL